MCSSCFQVGGREGGEFFQGQCRVLPKPVWGVAPGGWLTCRVTYRAWQPSPFGDVTQPPLRENLSALTVLLEQRTEVESILQLLLPYCGPSRLKEGWAVGSPQNCITPSCKIPCSAPVDATSGLCAPV